MADTTIKSDQLNSFGLEIGIFTIASTVVTIFILNAIKGNFARLEILFATKNWEFIQTSNKVDLIARLFKYLIFFIVSWPILSLIVWSIVVFKANPDDPLPGLSILLIGASVILYILGFLNLVWTNFRFNVGATIYIAIGTCCFLAF
jgi:hypothetical protein